MAILMLTPSRLMARLSPAFSFRISTILFFCLSAVFQTAAQKAGPAFNGTWMASAGAGQVLRGTWSGQTSLRSPNTAGGSWTLQNETNETVLAGTWSAHKTDQGWQGTWTAHTANGGSFSGTWDAYLPDFNGKTMEEMLKRTTDKQVAGSWRSGRRQGNWWLDGSALSGR
jgi:hypothetical protein